jgi:hypothetical protein
LLQGVFQRCCLILAIVGFVALPEGNAIGGSISGTVVIDGQPDASNVVVYLEGVSGTFRPSLKRPKMDHINLAFRPFVLPILKGTTVNFPNSDPVFHSAFSTSPSNPFELGIYTQGTGKSVTFDNVGEVEIFCHIHPYMHAFILVLDNPHFTVTDSRGRYALTGVSEGTYMIKAWQGFLQAKQTKTITVERTHQVTMDFRLHPERIAVYP